MAYQIVIGERMERKNVDNLPGGFYNVIAFSQESGQRQQGTSSQGTYVDNAQNRSLGRAREAVGSVPLSRGSSGCGHDSSGNTKTYADNSYNCSLGRVGVEHGTAVVSNSGSSGTSSQRTYVVDAQHRSLGRVGEPAGSVPVSRGASGSSYGSSSSTKTYADNLNNRSLGRVVVEHGTAVVSNSGSSGTSSQGTYVDNAQNRSLGRVREAVGSVPVSRGSSGCGHDSSGNTKTYADNSYNCSLGRVGVEHGTAVVSNSGSSGHPPQMTSSSPRNSYPGKVYEDNAMNRRLGRAGKPLGSMPHSISSSSKSSPSVYVDNCYNRALGRAGEPLGTMPVSKKSKQTEEVRGMFQWYRDHPGEVFQVMETDSDEYTAADIVMDLINRMNQVEIWQKETGNIRPPRTATGLRDRYEGTIIPFEDLDLQNKIGHGGFGDVHFAKWHGSVVAVKKLRVQRVSKKKLKEFTDELLVFCGLEHENIVKFIGACVVTPNLAIVMEYMQCGLHEAIHVEERDFSGVERLSIIEQIMHGLKYLHGKQIVHCDLKSQNVLLDLAYNPVAKLTDFGLSMMKAEYESSVLVAECVRNIGTPQYSAPEVLRGVLLGRKDMMKADMYSASLVVFEVICVEEPYPRLKYAQLREHVGNGTMKPDIPDGIQISAQLMRCLEACWSRDAGDRPTADSFWSTVKWLPSLLEE